MRVRVQKKSAKLARIAALTTQTPRQPTDIKRNGVSATITATPAGI